MSSVGHHLEEATDLRIDKNEDVQKIYVETAAKVMAEGQSADMTMGVLVETDPETGKVTETIEYTVDDGTVQVAAHGLMNMNMQEAAKTVDFSMSVDVTEDGKTYTAITEQLAATMADTDTTRSAVINGIYRIQLNAESAPVGVLFSAEDNSVDAGDHSEETISATISLEGGDELLTVNGTAVTGLAEAYIVSPDAVEVLSLSESDRNQMMSDIQAALPLTLMSLIAKLPASVQQLVMGQAMSGN